MSKWKLIAAWVIVEFIGLGINERLNRAMHHTHKYLATDDLYSAEEKWQQEDGKYCGSVSKQKDATYYVATAFKDDSIEHDFATLTEAEAWITGEWCKP